MQSARTLLPLALAISAALLTGCAGKDKTSPEQEWTGTPFEVSEYTPDLREHHTSWGHTGRGGAALRKPSYQPVLGSQDTLETRYGKLHPELQYKAQTVDASINVPPALVAGKCAEAEREQTAMAATAFAAPSDSASHSIYTLANRHGSVSDYISVRNKLCKGVERLTYEEWEILVMGTPKDVPLKLQPKLLNSVK